jgi:membrane protease YdiL (CAAX protease family)
MQDEAANVTSAGGPRVGLGPKKGLLVLFVYYAVQIVVGVVIGIGGGLWYVVSRGADDPQVVDLAQRSVVVPASLAGVVAGGVVAFRLARRSMPGPIASGALLSIGWSPARSRDLLLAAAAGVGLAFFYLFGLMAASPPSPNQQWGPLVSAAMSGGWARHTWAILALFVTPPVEEFVFRGVLFTGFSRSWMPGSAGALVLILFVAVHLPEVVAYGPAVVAVALVGGATLVARIVTNSLLPAIALHAFYNLGLVVATYAGAA